MGKPFAQGRKIVPTDPDRSFVTECGVVPIGHVGSPLGAFGIGIAAAISGRSGSKYAIVQVQVAKVCVLM